MLLEIPSTREAFLIYAPLRMYRVVIQNRGLVDYGHLIGHYFVKAAQARRVSRGSKVRRVSPVG